MASVVDKVGIKLVKYLQLYCFMYDCINTI